MISTRTPDVSVVAAAPDLLAVAPKLTGTAFLVVADSGNLRTL